MDKLFALDTGRLAEIKKAVASGKNTAVFYAAQNNRCHIAVNLGKRFIYVASDIVEAQKIYDRICAYGDGNYALLPESEDPLIQRKICSYVALGEKLRVLKDFAEHRLNGIVVTVESLMKFYPSKTRFLNGIIPIIKGEILPTDSLSEKLFSIGYKRVSLVDSPATFRFAGDVLEIFPINSEHPYRIEFFGDEVDGIRAFNLDTRLSQDETDCLEIIPATDIIVYKNEVSGVVNAIRRTLKNANSELRNTVLEIIETFESNPSSPLGSFLIPFIPFALGSLQEYAPNGTILILDDVRLVEDKIKLLRKSYENRAETLIGGGKLLPAHFDSVRTYEDIVSDRKNGTVLGFGRITSSINFFEPREIFDLKTSPLPQFYNDMEGFFTTVKQLLFRDVKIRVYAGNEVSMNALINAFNEHDIGITKGFTFEADIAIDVGKINYGFYYPYEKLMCVGINDLVRKSLPVRSNARKRVVFEIPEKGDYVVHEKHGIGISEGMQRVKTLSGEKDFFVVLYRGGDKLFLPVEQMNTIEKYNGADKPQIHKLGGAEFERVKNRVRASIKEMAIDLLEVYRARHNRKGFVYQPDTPWQQEFEEDFEFTETDDQLAAIAEIKHDMESGKIMDRLLCGDVGFGKTEVALRAVFKTIIENKQAAILAPTTILAQQHYNLLCARMNKFKINIVLLNRFVPRDKLKESVEKIKTGEAHIVVATHRLLSSDVLFKDLGLLVLDEEQRFGVEHKEKLKAFRNTVNVLSLSATPIPRTLHMALSGIRDISTLETPPKNRLPVETYVTEYSEDLLKTALEKELARGGQAFVLYNRVQGIENFYKTVQSLVDAEVVYAHGRMQEEELENAVSKFYNNEAQILVSTTIIENGIDLPNANTLFVIDADSLGLGQLYQLRGRVGRSEVLGYAYFTVREGKVLTTNAVQRLDALLSNTDLGSGFKIAMRDLEIRGAGNILGREQHGQMEKVGYEMYLKLIKEGIEEAQGKEVTEEVEPEIKINGDFALEEGYISDTKARIAVYKTVAVLSSSEEGNEYYKKMVATYGESSRLKNAVRIGILKNCAKKAGVKKVVIDMSGTGLFFADTRCLTNEKLFSALEKYKDKAVLCPSDNPTVVFKKTNRSVSAKIKEVKDFLEAICR